MNKLNVVAVTLVTVGLIPVGAGLLAQQPKRGGAGQRNGQSGQTTLTDMTPANPVIRAIVEARLATARQIFEEELTQIQQTNVPFTDDISVWSRHWMEAQLRLSPTMADKRAAIQAHVERARRVEKIAVEQANAGNFRTSDSLKAKYFRLEAEYLLAEARAIESVP